MRETLDYNNTLDYYIFNSKQAWRLLYSIQKTYAILYNVIVCYTQYNF
jgi:hypothetical protein